MSKIDKSEFEFGETIRPADLKTGGIDTIIVSVRELSTRYGDKRVLIFEGEKQVFLNAFSLKNLVEAYGDETESWIGQRIHIDVESSERTQKKASIIVSKPKDEKVSKK